MKPDPTPPFWLRPALAVLAIPNIVTGAWAVAAPASWFDNFPGWAPRLVAAFPPFNEHLATDAGAGLLSVGVLAALALVLPRRDIVVTATLGNLVFALPHALFHLANPADALSASEDIVNSITLVGAVVLSAAVFTYAWRTR